MKNLGIIKKNENLEKNNFYDLNSFIGIAK